MKVLKASMGMSSILCLVFLTASSLVLGQGLRPLTPRDIVNLETLDEVQMSLDGKQIAYVRSRASSWALTHKAPSQIGYPAGAFKDVWLVSSNGDNPTNLTNGDKDNSGCWSPRWSPNGLRLVMLCTKGSDHARLWVWNKLTNKLTQVGPDSIYSQLFNRALFTDDNPWLDDHRLFVLVPPEGEENSDGRYGILAVEAWQRRWAQKESTAAVMDSGVSRVERKLRSRLVIVDTDTGKSEKIDDAPILCEVSQSPNKRLLAYFAETDIRTPEPVVRVSGSPAELSGLRYKYQLKIVDSSNRPINFKSSSPGDVFPYEFGWALDGQAFAFIGIDRHPGAVPTSSLYRGKLDGTIEKINLSENEQPQKLIWAGNQLLALIETTDEKREKEGLQHSWLRVSPDGTVQDVSGGQKSVPDDLFISGDQRAPIGLADGDLWKLDVGAGRWSNLTASFEPKITGVDWKDKNLNSKSNVVVVSTSEGQSKALYRLDLATGATRQLALPSENATLTGYQPSSDLAIFTAAESTGTYLTFVQGDRRKNIVETNQFLKDVAAGQLKQIQYRGLDGQDLKGWILLPINYQDGHRYPLVTLVYAGTVFSDKRPHAGGINSDSYFNYQLLPARGYAVLFPSMPLKPSGQTDDVYLELTKGVLPAIDRAIDLGIADPNRLSVMGWSFGGFSTYGLITQTNRFKAAIAGAGPSDWISLYGTYSGGERENPEGDTSLFIQGNIESTQGHMGVPPWKDLGRYLRNSPINYVDRVETPIMIVQGDMDSVPIMQGEEFFNSLYRMGKRARFLRYFGEGHGISSPANILDFWNKTYAWLDEFCDISRDNVGNLIFDGNKVKSRNGAPPLKPEDFARFDGIRYQTQPTLKTATQ
jgi:dipeptidyl aminopeptidase/acylaminoacyl peptidase